MRQRSLVYFHPRDKDGSLKRPYVTDAPGNAQNAPGTAAVPAPAPLTKEEELARLDAIHAALRLANYAEARAAIEERWKDGYRRSG